MRNISNRNSSISEALTPSHVVNPGQHSTNDPDADGLSPCIVHVLVPWRQHCGQQAQCPTKAIHSLLDESVQCLEPALRIKANQRGQINARDLVSVP